MLGCFWDSGQKLSAKSNLFLSVSQPGRQRLSMCGGHMGKDIRGIFSSTHYCKMNGGYEGRREGQGRMTDGDLKDGKLEQGLWGLIEGRPSWQVGGCELVSSPCSSLTH